MAAGQDLAVLIADKWRIGVSIAGGAVLLNRFLDWVTRQTVASKKTTFGIVTNRSTRTGRFPVLRVALAVLVRLQPGFAETQEIEQSPTPPGKQISMLKTPVAAGTPTARADPRD